MSERPSQLSEPSTEVDRDLAPGEQVGEYVVDGKLGQGGFGAVFRATHPVIGKQVAIKVLARKFSVDPEMVSRFVAEARAVNQIRSRYIIDIFSFGKLADGRQYYVMEHLEGEPLDARLDRAGKLALGEALPILRGIARALDAAHAKGVAHRDLKAENVFLAAELEDGAPRVWPKLLDFGIAKLLGPDDGLKHKTRTGTPVGTPYYMSPEQCRGRDVDHRTDLYAFGVLAYLMLTGVYPHDADDYMSILVRQLTEEPAPPSRVNPELPAAVDDTIAWLLRKDPAARPSDLRTAVAALEAAAVDAGMSFPTAAWSGPVGAVPATARFATPSPAPARATTPGTAGVANLPTVNLPSGAVEALGASPTLTGEEERAATGPRAATDLADPTGADELDAIVPPARGRRGLVVGAALAVVAAIVAVVAVVAMRPAGDGAGGGGGGGAASARAPAPSPAPPPARVVAPSPAPAPAPAPAPPPIEVAPPPPPPAEAQTVIVTIEGVPDGTEVLVGGMTAGAAPGPVQLPRDDRAMVLTFKRDGYLPASRSVVPDHDQRLKLALKKRPARGKARSTKEDIIDVFPGGNR